MQCIPSYNFGSSFCPHLKSKCIQGSVPGFQGLCCRLTSVFCSKTRRYLCILWYIFHRARSFIFLSIFFFLNFWQHCSLWDLRYPVRDWIQNTAVKALGPNHWMTRGFPPGLLSDSSSLPLRLVQKIQVTQSWEIRSIPEILWVCIQSWFCL